MSDDKFICQWPNSKVRKHIQKAIEPEHSWKKYEVTILMETDSYDDAIKYEKKKSLTSDSSDENSEPVKARKIKLKIHDDYLSDVSESDIDSPPALKKCDYDKPTSPRFSNESPATSDTLSPSDEEENPISEIDVDAILMPPPPIPTNNLNDEVSGKENTGQTRRQRSENSGLCCTHGFMINSIFENIVATRALLKEQCKNFENVIENMVVRREENVMTLESVPKKPFKLYRKLVQYDDEIKKSGFAKKQLETVFFMCGGPNGKCLIRRGLAKLFTDSLAKKCSWTGKGNNFPVRHLIVMGTLKDAARKRFPDITDAYFEIVISNWFRQAQLRYNRAEARKNM